MLNIKSDFQPKYSSEGLGGFVCLRQGLSMHFSLLSAGIGRSHHAWLLMKILKSSSDLFNRVFD